MQIQLRLLYRAELEAYRFVKLQNVRARKDMGTAYSEHLNKIEMRRPLNLALVLESCHSTAPVANTFYCHVGGEQRLECCIQKLVEKSWFAVLENAVFAAIWRSAFLAYLFWTTITIDQTKFTIINRDKTITPK